MTFAEHLEAAMAAQPSPPPTTPFADTLRSFEDALGPGWTDVAAQARESGLPAWAAVLGVVPPCSLREVKCAFRRLALQTHPDRPGGSHDAFLEAQRVLQEAIEALERNPPARANPGIERFTRSRAVPASGGVVQSFA